MMRGKGHLLGVAKKKKGQREGPDVNITKKGNAVGNWEKKETAVLMQYL